MAGNTVKVSDKTRERICTLAENAGCTQGAVIERALDCYERALRAEEYLEGWRRFERESPNDFAAYMADSKELDDGFSELWRD